MSNLPVDAPRLYNITAPEEPAPPRGDEAAPLAVPRPDGRFEDLCAWLAVLGVIGGLFVFFFIASERLAGPLAASQGGERELPLAALYMLNVRSNAAFLVGSFIAMTGAMLVLKGARARVTGGFDQTGGIRASLATDSPGLFLSVMGAVIIIVTLFRGANLEVGQRPAPVDPARDLTLRDYLQPGSEGQP